jgi:hypothetical protein
MGVPGLYLYDIGKLAEKLAREFGALPYEKFAEDANKIESAVMRLRIMKEGWSWLPGKMRQGTRPDRLGRCHREVGPAGGPARGR